MHRVTEESALTESADRSIAREGHSKPLHSALTVAATSA